MTDSNYWKQRAERYNNLEWVNSDSFMKAIISAGKFKSSDWVLDVGTGTGVVAYAVAPLVRYVTAIDNSPDMMDKINHRPVNVMYKVCDAKNIPWKEETFDKVVARYVLHHITDGVRKAMNECYRVLKPGGLMIFAEGVPPSQRTKQDFINIFRLKEDRLTFMPDDMKSLVVTSGFKPVATHLLKLRGMSIKNWLDSSDLDTDTQARIFAMHVDAPQYFKDDYDMVITDDDCLISMTVAIVVGAK
jgi:ubiquinone/menaquinone biosynthesis C-methylase UbiE